MLFSQIYRCLGADAALFCVFCTLQACDGVFTAVFGNCLGTLSGEAFGVEVSTALGIKFPIHSEKLPNIIPELHKSKKKKRKECASLPRVLCVLRFMFFVELRFWSATPRVEASLAAVFVFIDSISEAE